MEECKHRNVVLSVIATQEAWLPETGVWEYEEVENIERNEEAYEDETYCYCKDCNRYLTKKEVDELGID